MPEADVDRIEQLAASAALDVSPRGVAPRTDEELARLLDGLGPEDAAELADRLTRVHEPLPALILGGALARIGTPYADAVLDAYAQRLRDDDPWPGKFPGAREVLLYLGRGAG